MDAFTDAKGYYVNEDELMNQIRDDVARGEKIAGRKPRVLVIGALGRCGRYVLPFSSLESLQSKTAL